MKTFRKAVLYSTAFVLTIVLSILFLRVLYAQKNRPETFFCFEDVPEYSGEPYVIINDNHVFFEETRTVSEVTPGELDDLGRVTEAVSCIGKDLLPQEDRGLIGMVKPSGWQTQRYDDLIEDHYLYNRCHLIAYMLSGLNAEKENLFTGTRYLNVTGMLPWEILVYDYVEDTGNHVEYHVLPVFEGDDLVCRGVLIQAKSSEDNGKGLEFCVFCYNVQPGVIINYSDGTSEREVTRDMPAAAPQDYILNTNTKRFHYPDCDSVKDMKEKNKQAVNAVRDELIEEGYVPCGVCNP